MRYTFAYIIGILLGAGVMFLIFVSDDREYFTVRILDNDKCSDPRYPILMENYSVTVSGDQIDTLSPSIAMEAEVHIHVMPPYNGETKHSYRVTAEYSDCEAISSMERKVERGRILDEWIENGKIKHQVRS